MIDNDLQTKFNIYINELKKQSIDIKKNEVINSLKELLSVLDIICQQEGIVVNYLKSNQIIDLFDENNLEDHFIEACLVYIENVKNILSKYLMDKDLF